MPTPLPAVGLSDDHGRRYQDHADRPVCGTLAAVHAHLGDRILHSMIVGKSHHDAPGAAIDGGPQPELFFAPTEVERRIAELGPGEYRSQLANALAAFVDGSRRWLEIEHHRGPAAFQAAWALALDGALAPSVGLIASMGD